MNAKANHTRQRVFDALRCAMAGGTRDALDVLSFVSGYLRRDEPEIVAEIDRVIDRDLERGEFSRRSA